MEQPILEPQAQSSTSPQTEQQLTAAKDVIKPLDDDVSSEFNFWEDLKESMPPWINEVVGFALIVFGILSFISLYIASDALVAVDLGGHVDCPVRRRRDFRRRGPLRLWHHALASKGRGSVSASALPKCWLWSSSFFRCSLSCTWATATVNLRALARAGTRRRLNWVGPELSVFQHTWAAGGFGVIIALCLIAICAVVTVGLRRRHVYHRY